MKNYVKYKDTLLKVWDAAPSKFEWIVVFILLGFCYISFAQTDIMVTGNRSFLMYEHFLDFYEASFFFAGDYGANYLPSTFWLFAIWNLPLYLLGKIPGGVLNSAFMNTMWYKLLPLLFYIASAFLMEKIAIEIGMGKKKAKLCKFAFVVCPIAVFSQFIFSQYDVITVFFMLLGLYYWLKDDWKKFCLFFGIAITFKYHALMYFIVLLLLKEKRVWHIIKQLIICVLPLVFEVAIYIRDPYFVQSVFGFQALNKVNATIYTGFMGEFNLIVIIGLLIFMWAYTVNAKEKTELVKWMTFLCSGISFLMFGICAWHPQWLIILVPFLVFTVFMNENGKVILLLQNVFIIAFYIFTVNYFVNNVDQIMLYNGIFKWILQGKIFVIGMNSVYVYNNISMLCSVMTGLLLLYFVFNHPKYHIQDIQELKSDIVGNVKLLFLVGIFSFIIPAGITLLKTLLV